MQRRFRDRLTIALEAHVARLLGSLATIAHHERPDYLDRLSVLRNQVFVLDHMFMSVFSTCGWILRLAVAIALLVSIHPALALLALFAVPAVFTSAWRPGVQRVVEEKAAPHGRLASHLFVVATTAPPGKEVRVTRIGERLARERRAAWERWYAPVASARWTTAAWHTAAWAVFGLAYVGAIVFVSSGLRAPAGDVLLVLAAGARLSSYIGATVARGRLPARHLARRRAPARVARGLRGLVHGDGGPGGAGAAWPTASGWRTSRSRTPGRSASCSRTSTSTSRPGPSSRSSAKTARASRRSSSSSASSTSRPPARILADGVPLARMRADDWRARLSGAFQDFFRFEFPALHSVGVGDLPRRDDRAAVAAAVDRAGASDVIANLPHGLDTQLGPAWPGGVELSFGQWQKLALARGFMREAPLLLVLDEPTAALDAETEHALFERYASAARGNGRLTILVSHRFSTVRMADRIVVLDGARVREVGTHEELMAKAGPYSELYGIQAAAYR